MKVTPDCVPCLLKRAMYETRLVGGDEPAAVRAALDKLGAGYDPAIASATLATRVHRAVYAAIGTKDPYRELKARANDVARTILPRAQELVSGAEDPLATAALCAVVGNVMDFGIEGSSDDPADLVGEFDDLVGEGLGHDDLPAAREYLVDGAIALYFLDNCGEVVLDTLLVRELERSGVRVKVVAKGEPILTDATLDDAREAGMDSLATSLLDTGVFAVGLDLDRIPPDLAVAMESADIIISKGMANYEAMSERDLGPVLHLMRTKCRPVAQSLGLPVGISVAKLVDAN